MSGAAVRNWRRLTDELDDTASMPQNDTSVSIRTESGQARAKKKPTFKNAFERHSMPLAGYQAYFTDLFHTLLNMSRHRFVILFIIVYLLNYLMFATLYYLQEEGCVHGIYRFEHALWFSVQTASTIGFGRDLAPDPDCVAANVLVTFQVIWSMFLDYCIMGLMFARFASPEYRSGTVTFSKTALLHKHHSGYWCIAIRVALYCKKALISPHINVQLAIPGEEDGTSPTVQFEELEVYKLNGQCASIKLGLPAEVVHVISPSSPLYHLSLSEIESRNLEVVVFIDGIDPMTSNALQARHSYMPHDIVVNARFAPVNFTTRRGKVGLDFMSLDRTMPGDDQDMHIAVGMHIEPGLALIQFRELCFSMMSSAPHKELPTSGVSSPQLESVEFTNIKVPRDGGVPQSTKDTNEDMMRKLCAAVMADPLASSHLKKQASIVQAHLYN